MEMKQTPEETHEKIRVKCIELVDDSDNVVMKLGPCEDAEDELIPITIFDKNENEVCELGFGADGEFVKVSGENGSVVINNTSSGGHITVFNDDDNCSISIRAREGGDSVFGFLNFFRSAIQMPNRDSNSCN